MLKLTPGVDPIVVAFQAGYASCAQTASDLIAFTGADVDDWMTASRNILTQTELAELAHAAAEILARRNSTAVAA
ncbi:hypothetical protein ACLQ2R_17035 [Streptosporangium sp. DT93]|uniref:hypothetical protein n=1 Tax=Streptosporangium sp. DT93 TaxID=3393428 RepID=UPI003CF8FB63